MALEATLIMASYFRSLGPLLILTLELHALSELYAHYKSETESAGDTEDLRNSYSSRVIRYADDLYKGLDSRRNPLANVKASRLLDRDAMPG